MYSNKQHLNILTSLLITHGIEDAVACPGSRNAPIIHNLWQTNSIKLYAVTDERSAAFVAIGIWLVKRKPIALCVTSGSALLNTLPGVAEATYRNIPLIIISADRPPQWIGQLDGQTIPQIDALLPYARCWNLPEFQFSLEEKHYCQRLANEALLACSNDGGTPIHINIPLSEPLFEFSEPSLPIVNKVHSINKSSEQPFSKDVLKEISSAARPLLVIGQYEDNIRSVVNKLLNDKKISVYAENISNQDFITSPENIEQFNPDLIIHIGGAFVNKKIKQHLRKLDHCIVMRIDNSSIPADTFCHLRYHIKADPATALKHLLKVLPEYNTSFLTQIQTSQLDLQSYGCKALFLANSSPVRWMNQYFQTTNVPVFCNRGTNGIEGSLSTAVGFALAIETTQSLSTGRQNNNSRNQILSHSLHSPKVLCIIGDLSFFYDSNALWNQELRGSLRILLVNNGGGAIFEQIPGMTTSPAFSHFIFSAHQNKAEGIAISYNCHYKHSVINSINEIECHIYNLLSMESESPIIYELFLAKNDVNYIQ